jgi:RNA polymerase sigma-70 factor (ECF subfamily)
MKSKRYEQFLQCQAKLYRFAYSLVKNVGDAEDIFQDTLIKIWELRREWDNWTNFEAYTMRMLRNTFLNFKKKKYNRLHVELDDVVESPQLNDIEKGIVIADLHYKFNVLIGKLPEVQKDILYLREIEELEYKEIGEILDLTEAQVKVYLFRGRQHLKNKVHGTR